MNFWKGLRGDRVGKLNMKLMQGIEDAENQIQKEKQIVGGQKAQETQVAPDNVREPVRKPQIAPKQSKSRKNTKKSEKTENKPNTSLQKQVFSFRAAVFDITIWKAYATASEKTMEYIGNAAMNEYIKRHKLNEVERAVFEALMVREKRE